MTAALLALALAATPAKSVYTLHVADAAVLAGSAAIIVSGYTIGGRLITPRCPCDPRALNVVDRSVVGWNSKAADYGSDALVGLSLAAPLALAGWDDRGSPAFAEDAAIDVEAVLVAGAAVTVVKDTVERPLPVVYAGQAPNLVNRVEGYRSFYSGHVTLATAALSAAAMTWNLRHGAAAWPWLVTAGAATLIAAGRLAAGQHFYSDVGVGAAAGLAIGTLVPALHHSGGPVQVGLAPAPRGALASAAFAW